MIKPESIKEFWENRGKKYKKLPIESITNLEESPELLQLKIDLETQKVSSLLKLKSDMRVLDLGAGYGLWSFRMASMVKEIVAVEYASNLCEIGEKERVTRGVNNISFVNSPAEEYKDSKPFDLIFISGLFVYMTDEQAKKLLMNLPHLIAKGGMLFLRDGTSILQKRHMIVDSFSNTLKETYSALYRTRDEYIALLTKAGFSLQEDGQMFDEGCPLNKYPETRLRYYIFEKTI